MRFIIGLDGHQGHITMPEDDYMEIIDSIKDEAKIRYGGFRKTKQIYQCKTQLKVYIQNLISHKGYYLPIIEREIILNYVIEEYENEIKPKDKFLD